MDFVLPDENSIRLIAPFADMLNHSSEVKQCHVYDASSGCISVLAGKDYKAGDQVRSFCSPTMLDLWLYHATCSFRFLSIMVPFRITAFYVSMALSYRVIPTTAMISSFQRTLRPHFGSRSNSSGYRLDSIRPVPSLSLSPIRYRKMSFDNSVFSDSTKRISPSCKSTLRME